MSFTVYLTNKKTGVVYAYSQTAYRDPVTKKPKSKRTYLGRVDPVTKEIVPKESEGKRNRSKLGEIVVVNDENKNLEGNLHNQLDVELIESQRQQIESLSSEISHLRLILSQMQSLMANV